MSTSVAETTDLAQRLDRVAVSFSEATVTVLDLVLLGMLRGDWWELERRARRGLALRREGGNPVTKADLHAAATSFRYAHDLVSAEDFQNWLRERGIGVGDLAAYLQRTLLQAGAADESGGTPAVQADPDDERELAQALWAEAICSGTLAALATAAGDLVVAESAVAGAEAEVEGTRQTDVPSDILERAATDAASGVAARPGEDLHERLARLAGLQLAMARLRTEVAEPEALARVVAGHGLEWMSVTGTELEFATEGAALEARLLVTVDGLDVESVIRLAGERCPGAPRPRELLIADAPPELGGVIAAALPGEVVGPWPDGDRHRLLLVAAKRPPSLETSSLRETAIAERLADVLRHHGAGRLERPLAL
ncbi:MAG: hypothetical protein WAK93_19930 [Solirubrobacteraceae bacterium]